MRNLIVALAVVAMLAMPAAGAVVFDEGFESGTVGIFSDNMVPWSGNPGPAATTYAAASLPARVSDGGGGTYAMDMPFGMCSSQNWTGTSFDGGAPMTLITTEYETSVWYYFPNETAGGLAVNSYTVAQADWAAVTVQDMRTGADWDFQRASDGGAMYMIRPTDANDLYDGTTGDLLLVLNTNPGGTNSYILTPVPVDTWVKLYAYHDITNLQVTYKVTTDAGAVLHSGTVAFTSNSSYGDIPTDAWSVGTCPKLGYRNRSPITGHGYFDNYKMTNIPEPATLSLLALGGLGVLIRRRRK